MKISRTILIAILLSGLGSVSLPAVSGATIPAVELGGQVPSLEEEWPSSSPDAQGMDGALLGQLREVLREDAPHIRSLLVVRHGRLVFEHYGKGLGADDLHEIGAITQSFTATLVGVALEKGLLHQLDQPISEFLPEAAETGVDPRVRNITIADLLAMKSGFVWTQENWEDCLFYGFAKEGCGKYEPESLDYALRRPLTPSPKRELVTNDIMNSHLLSEILARAGKTDVASLLETNLLQPLGVPRYAWEDNSKGVKPGGRGLLLRGRDIAKLGKLYLDHGLWCGKRLIPADYAKASTTEQGFESSGYFTGYGYHWWILSGSDNFFSWSPGGQSLAVYPAQDMVVVTTTSYHRTQTARDDTWIMNDFITPAIRQ